MTKIYFTEDHEWLSVENGVATIGITQHAQEQLGDLVFVDLPAVGATMSQGDTSAVVESVKAASDVFSPLNGKVIEVNEELSTEPALVNEAAEGKGWLWKMTIANEDQLADLMDEAAYKTMIG